MTIKYGLIAEDVSDIEVIKKLARKITGKNISSAYFVGKGCGPIKKKSVGWCNVFRDKGCSHILLVHDRDRNDALQLKSELEAILVRAPQQNKVVIVPCEELEAWLLSDQNAIKIAFKLKKAIKEEHHPETIDSPKEFLGKLVWQASEKTVNYVNAVHNSLIVDHIDIKKILVKCPSFAGFSEFFKPLVKASAKRQK